MLVGRLIAGLLLLSALPASAASPPPPEITLYAKDLYDGASLQLILPAYDLHTQGFADRTLSFIVNSGTWQLCDRPKFAGHCITVGPGKYRAGYDNGFAKTVVSLRPVSKA